MPSESDQKIFLYDLAVKFAAGLCILLLAVLFAAYLPDLPYWAKIACCAVFGWLAVTLYKWLYGRWRPIPKDDAD